MLRRAAGSNGLLRLPLHLLSGVLIAVTLPAMVALATFDPPQEQQIVPDDRQAGDQFGIAVAVDSSLNQGYLVVGAFRNDQVATDAGKAYVFERGTGAWVQMDELFAPDAVGGGRFGAAVAIDGGTLAVGAPGVGAVYVFDYEPAGDEWVFKQKLTASDGVFGDAFGWAVDIQGDTIAVGALEKDAGLGAAYAFVRDGFGDWSEQGRLADPDGEAGDFLGISVSVDGDRIAVGAYQDVVLTAAGLLEKGSVSLFERSMGVWTFDEKVFSFGGNPFIEFGRSVALDGSELSVGAPNDTPPFIPGSTIRVTGTVYRYDTTADPISSSQVRIWPSDKGVIGGPREFGFSLGLDGNVLAIGAYGDRAGSSGIDAGSVYLFDLDDNLLNESLKITAPVPNQFDFFGFTVAVSGDDIAVGADREDIDPITDDNAGAAYVYSLPAPGAVASSLTALATIAFLRRRRHRGDRA